MDRPVIRSSVRSGQFIKRGMMAEYTGWPLNSITNGAQNSGAVRGMFFISFYV
jgi:hypothetical protein